jgi:hypothetical protein
MTADDAAPAPPQGYLLSFGRFNIDNAPQEICLMAVLMVMAALLSSMVGLMAGALMPQN